MNIQICVGSSCHIKGSPEIIALLQDAITTYHLENKVVLSGRFCTGHCNRIGVTIQVNETVHTGITIENFKEFFKDNILSVIERSS